MIYLFSRCSGGLFHRHMIILKLLYLLYTSFMLNDQSTDSVVLKAKLQSGPILSLLMFQLAYRHSRGWFQNPQLHSY